MKVIAPAVASGRWFDYLAEMTPLMGDAADWQAFHPMARRSTITRPMRRGRS